MWNYDRYKFAGAIGNSTQFAGQVFMKAPMANAWFYSAKLGVRPTDKLDILAAVSFGTADQKNAVTWGVATYPGILNPSGPSNYSNYGTEIDIIGTYKITNNLSYMLGAGYLLTGDYYKGTNAATQVVNNYLVINKLTLTF